MSSHFGAGGMESFFYEEVEDLGAHWLRIHFDVTYKGIGQVKPVGQEIPPRAFIFEPVDLSLWDEMIRQAGEHEILVYGIIDPRRLDNRYPSPQEFAGFVKEIVERYDGDGEGDIPNLPHPVLVWEICNEVGIGWQGFTEDLYVDYVKATYRAVKETCPACRLASGAIVERPNSHFERLLERAVDSFDIISYHSYRYLLNVDGITRYFQQKDVKKPIWLTESQFGGMLRRENKPQEQIARELVKSYVYALARGFDKVFPSELKALPRQPEGLRWSCLIDEKGNKRPSFQVYKTLIKKIDFFTETSVIKAGPDVYVFKFLVDGKPVHVLWGFGSLPQEIQGQVVVTNMYGKEVVTDSSQVKLTDEPIYVEELGK